MVSLVRKSLICIIILFSATITHAQYGFKAGVNIPNVTVDSRTFTVPEVNNKIGFNIGAFISIREYETFSLRSGLTFERKSIEGKRFATPSGSSAEMSVDYLIYSITGKYTFLEWYSKTSPYLLFSPRLNFYLGNDYSSNPQLSQSQEDIISDKMRKIGFGISMGGGIEFMRDKNVIPFLEVQFSPDFFNSYDSEIISFKSNSIEAMVGIRFDNSFKFGILK